MKLSKLKIKMSCNSWFKNKVNKWRIFGFCWMYPYLRKAKSIVVWETFSNTWVKSVVFCQNDCFFLEWPEEMGRVYTQIPMSFASPSPHIHTNTHTHKFSNTHISLLKHVLTTLFGHFLFLSHFLLIPWDNLLPMTRSLISYR